MGFMGKRVAGATLLAASLLLAIVPAAQATFPGQNGKIAFDDLPGGAGVFTINPDGSGQTLVAPGAFWPAWSSDGGRLAYFASRPQVNDGLNVANADGSGRVLVRAATLSAGPDSSREDLFKEPAWSPDGGTIAYQAMEVACGGHSGCFDLIDGIRSIGPNGAGDRLLVDSPTAGDPAFSPDGSRLAWSDDPSQIFPAHVHVSNADGTGDTILTADGGGVDP
jgi:WD40 repeat protein